VKTLYTNVLPMQLKENQTTIIDCLHEQIGRSDCLDIAVGYISKAALEELDLLVERHGLTKVCLVIGMYFIEGMPEASYHLAMNINERWQKRGIGEIRMVNAFKYHGKVYCFAKNNMVHSCVIGSANLGVLKLDAGNRRQYEFASYFDDPLVCREVSEHIEELKSPKCSVNISDAVNFPIIREINTSLMDIELVEQAPQKEAELYEQYETDISFVLPIKVPPYNERHSTEKRHFTKSNLNVCYAAPRSARKARDWYEVQMTVGAETYRLPNYPERNKPFFVITDDGYFFKVHTTSDNNKQFSAVGDELILGRWLKGRLAAAGLVTPVNNTLADTDRHGMITQEMLAAYGCDELVLTKTTKKALDENNNELDVWRLLFVPKSLREARG
jgi:hypothetical protein